MPLFGKQIGVARVTREAEVEQHGFTRGTQNKILRLEVEVNDLLKMNAVHGVGKCRPDAGDIFRWKRCAGDDRGHTLAIDPFHYDVRRCADIACCDEAWDVRPGQSGKGKLLHLQADDAERRFAVSKIRRFEHDREAGLAPRRCGHPKNGSGPTLVDAVAEDVALDDPTRM